MATVKAPVKRAAAAAAPVAAAPPAKTGPKRKPFDYTRFRVAFRKPEDFAAFLAGYPDMTGVLAYYWRLVPKINMKLLGQKETNIRTTAKAEEMTPDFCARTWGSGLYMLKFHDANRDAHEQEVARTWFEIDDPDLPAIYDPRTLMLNDASNADEVARLLAAGVLVRDGEYGAPRLRTESTGPAPVVLAPAAAPVAVVPGGGAFGGLGDQLILKLLDRALPSAVPQSASEQLAQSFQIAERFKGPSIDQIADAVTRRLGGSGGVSAEIENWEKVNGLLERLGVGRKNDQPDTAAAAAAAAAAATAATVPGWVAFCMPYFDNMLRPLLPMIGGYLASKMPAPPPRPPVAALPAAAPVAPVRLVLLPETANIMDRIQQVCELGISRMDGGVTGFTFATWLIGFYPGGAELFRMFEKAGGTAGLMAQLRMNEAYAARLDDPARAAALQVFLDDFFQLDLSAAVAPEAEQAAA